MPLMPEGNHKDPFSFMACNNPYMTVKVLGTAQVEFTFYTDFPKSLEFT